MIMSHVMQRTYNPEAAGLIPGRLGSLTVAQRNPVSACGKVGFRLKPGRFENIPAKSHAEFRLCSKCWYETIQLEA